MLTPYIVMIVGVLLAAGAAFWTLRAVRRAGANAGTGRFVLLVCACASVVALGVYLINGRPELAGGAYAERIAALKLRPRETYTMDDGLAVLHDEARADPAAAWPWLARGQVHGEVLPRIKVVQLAAIGPIYRLRHRRRGIVLGRCWGVVGWRVAAAATATGQGQHKADQAR